MSSRYQIRYETEDGVEEEYISGFLCFVKTYLKHRKDVYYIRINFYGR